MQLRTPANGVAAPGVNFAQEAVSSARRLAELATPGRRYTAAAVSAPGRSPVATGNDQTAKTAERTTMQQIKMILRAAEAQNGRFPVIMKALYSLVLRR
jgi:hypothetical protein